MILSTDYELLYNTLKNEVDYKTVVFFRRLDYPYRMATLSVINDYIAIRGDLAEYSKSPIYDKLIFIRICENLGIEYVADCRPLLKQCLHTINHSRKWIKNLDPEFQDNGVLSLMVEKLEKILLL